MKIKEAILKNEIDEVKEFLRECNLQYDENVDKTYYITNDNVIGTISIHENIVKCLAVSKSFQGENLALNLISSAVDYIFSKNYDNCFVYSKHEYQSLFENVGFKLITKTEDLIFMEFNSSIVKTLSELKKKYNITKNNYASIVVNCNPMTNGHLFLIEKCARENENVIVFVVEEDKSCFSFKNRFEVVKSVCEKFDNVVVVPSSTYLISNATFPTYFLKCDVDKDKVAIDLDLKIFKEYFQPIFHITKRYVGSEPKCMLTKMYNERMHLVLDTVCEVDRVSNEDQVISASFIRELISERKLSEIEKLVPKRSYEMIKKCIK